VPPDEDELDIEALRIVGHQDPVDARPRRVLRYRRGEWFLRGPIPLAWLSDAAAQPGKALAVALEIWLWAGIKKSRVVSISLSHLRIDPDASRSSASRGLRALERASLVAVRRDPGKKPEVTLLEKARQSPTTGGGRIAYPCAAGKNGAGASGAPGTV
jgi:hypothetical protein